MPIAGVGVNGEALKRKIRDVLFLKRVRIVLFSLKTGFKRPEVIAFTL